MLSGEMKTFFAWLRSMSSRSKMKAERSLRRDGDLGGLNSLLHVLPFQLRQICQSQAGGQVRDPFAACHLSVADIMSVNRQ